MRHSVEWSADPQVQQTVELLRQHGLTLLAGHDGLRAVTAPAGTVAELLGGLIRHGWKFRTPEPADRPRARRRPSHLQAVPE